MENNFSDLESSLEEQERNAEEILRQEKDIENREKVLDQALQQLREDVKVCEFLHGNYEMTEQAREHILSKREEGRQHLLEIEQELQNLVSEVNDSQAVLSQLKEIGEDVSEGEEALEKRREWLEACQSKAEIIAEILSLDLGELRFTESSKSVEASFGAEGQVENRTEEKTPREKFLEKIRWKSNETNYEVLLSKLDQMGIAYNPVKNHTLLITDEEIISALSDDDNTCGSCASVGLAYIGQRQGWDVLDFRGGGSQYFFSQSINLYVLSCIAGIKTLKADGENSLTIGKRLLELCEEGKEYYLAVGRHVSIVRKKDGVLQYLELQSERYRGWTDFDRDIEDTLNNRFGCTSISDQGTSAKYDFMIDIDESNFWTDDFKSLLGFINTSEDVQTKGKYGTDK